MRTWINQQSTHVFWLATASAYKDAVMQIGSITDAHPLFYGDEFSETMPLSPWLVPITSLIQLEDELLKQGILLCSNQPMFSIVNHLRSLLIAGLDGVEVLFRFYDPQVIIPMLGQMNEADRSKFMGNIYIWAYWHNESVTALSNPHVEKFNSAERPWWIIKPEHLEHCYNLETHGYIFERRFWHVIPDVMKQLPDATEHIHNSLTFAISKSLTPEQRELYVLADLLQRSNCDFDTQAAKFNLSFDEKQTLRKYYEDLS